MWFWFKKPMFLKHGTINVHHKGHKMEPVAPAKKLCEIQKEAHGSCCTSIKLQKLSPKQFQNFCAANKLCESTFDSSSQNACRILVLESLTQLLAVQNPVLNPAIMRVSAAILGGRPPGHPWATRGHGRGFVAKPCPRAWSICVLG